MTEYIGIFAAIMTTSSFLPQAIKIMRTGETESISLIMYILFVCGVSGWLSYGVMIESVPIICSNAVTLVSASTILFLKIRAMRKSNRLTKETQPVPPVTTSGPVISA